MCVEFITAKVVQCCLLKKNIITIRKIMCAPACKEVLIGTVRLLVFFCKSLDSHSFLEGFSIACKFREVHQLSFSAQRYDPAHHL